MSTATNRSEPTSFCSLETANETEKEIRSAIQPNSLQEIVPLPARIDHFHLRLGARGLGSLDVGF